MRRKSLVLLLSLCGLFLVSACGQRQAVNTQGSAVIAESEFSEKENLPEKEEKEEMPEETQVGSFERQESPEETEADGLSPRELVSENDTAGQGVSENDETSGNVREETEAENGKSDGRSEENRDKSWNVTVYYGDGNGEGLLTEETTVKELTAENLLAKLFLHNIVSVDTRVESFSRSEDGKKITLDLSASFLDYLETMSPTGEKVIMSSLADTFLKAFHAEEIIITVEGKTLETNNYVYDKALRFTESLS